MNEKNLEITDIKPKTFVLGDLHNGYRALLQVLKLSGFNKEEDQLIGIGDYVDGWPDAVECIDELLTIKNFIGIRGNHDDFFMEFLNYGHAQPIWLTQGGQATFDSYVKHKDAQTKMITHRREFFDKLLYYYIDENQNAFVHGGYLSKEGLGHDDPDDYIWDRTLWSKAQSAKKEGLKMTKMYNRVFLGHTSIGVNSLPKKCGNVINLDTGGGHEFKLTIMNVETEEYFMSDRVIDLYPEIKAIRGFKVR